MPHDAVSCLGYGRNSRRTIRKAHFRKAKTARISEEQKIREGLWNFRPI